MHPDPLSATSVKFCQRLLAAGADTTSHECGCARTVDLGRYLVDGSVKVNGGSDFAVHADDVTASLNEVSCRYTDKAQWPTAKCTAPLDCDYLVPDFI